MQFSEKYIYGTAKLHHLYFRYKIYNILDTAYQAGFRVFDTSPYYGLGLNERILVEWIKKRGHRDVLVHTKIGLSYPIWRSRNIVEFIVQKVLLFFGFCSVLNFRPRLDIWIKHNLQPEKVFIHEPENFGKSNITHLLSSNNIDFSLIKGFAGKLCTYDLKFKDKMIHQVPFEDYPKGDIFYGIFSSKSTKFKHSMEGKFIYSSNSIYRIIDFSNGKL